MLNLFMVAMRRKSPPVAGRPPSSFNRGVEVYNIIIIAPMRIIGKCMIILQYNIYFILLLTFKYLPIRRSSIVDLFIML